MNVEMNRNEQCNAPNPQSFLQWKRIYIDISTGKKGSNFCTQGGIPKLTHVYSLSKVCGFPCTGHAGRLQWGPCPALQSSVNVLGHVHTRMCTEQRNYRHKFRSKYLSRFVSCLCCFLPEMRVSKGMI